MLKLSLSSILLVVIVAIATLTWNAKHTYKMGTFTFDDGNMMKVRLTEDNSLTYELLLPKDWTIRIGTILEDGLKDSFILSLNNTEVTLENYIQTTGSKAPTLKVEGEYLLIQKDFKQRIFSVRKFIYDSKLNNVMIPINRKILIEYQNEVFPFENYNISEKSETIFFKINLNTREFRRLDGGEEGDLKSHGIGLYVAWTLLSYMMLITGRYMKYFYLWRMILHTALGVIILILTIIFVFS